MAERISVKRAAELTGLSQLSIRLGLQFKDLPFGTAIKTSNKRTVYHISPALLAKYLGMSIEDIKGE